MDAEELPSDTSLLYFLECDPRPTFIIDTATALTEESIIKPVYNNPALLKHEFGELLATVQGKECLDLAAWHKFRNWATTAVESPSATDTVDSLIYNNFTWAKVVLHKRWNVLSGTRFERLEGTEPRTITRSISQDRSFDWTASLPPKDNTSHIQFARNTDWANSPLGSMHTWSTQLRSAANLIMQDPRPAVLFWGPEVVMIYNEPYTELIGGLHPMCMGKSARNALAVVWHDFEPIIIENLAGKPVEETNKPVVITRNGFLEETYFSMKFLPIFDGQGATIGHFETVSETTKQVLLQRRLSMVLELSEEINKSRSVTDYWTLVKEVLSHHEKDVPFALLYSVETEGGPAEELASVITPDSGEDTSCMLRGVLGWEGSSPPQLQTVLFNDTKGLMPYFRKAMVSGDPIVVVFDDDTISNNPLIETMAKTFGETCKSIAIFSVNPTSGDDHILGFVVIGLNPLTPYDDGYHQFILVTSRLLSASLTSILLNEKDIQRREKAMDRAEALKTKLMQQLLVTQREVERSSLKFKRFAEGADIGIFIVGLDGLATYRNEAWYNIFQPDNREVNLDDGWDMLIDEEYAEKGRARFAELMEKKNHQSFELRLKRTWTVPNWHSAENQQPMWVLCSAFPELSEDGEILEIIGCVTDISRQKWGEKVQSARALDAQESKRQLENFIDTTSHEMRNPLSAIVQCADGILSSHKEHLKSSDPSGLPQSTIHTAIESAETIVQCSQHMKCIVDDVLTMSKLDSGLLAMTPVAVQPEILARHSVKMFEAEAKSADVGLIFELEESWQQSQITWVSMDPTRLTQVLINLITNAIKFTRLEKIRNVVVSMGLSLQRPSKSTCGHIVYGHIHNETEAQSLRADWELGETIYVHFMVHDTGRGLTEAEKDLLFARFSQASPRTHINYGGSGLGLFISRRLTEMHGGAIGFASNTGAGSTFSFYMKARKLDSNFAQPGDSRASPNSAIGPTTNIPPLPDRTASSHAVQTLSQSPSDTTTEKPRDAKDFYVLVVEDNLVNQRVLAKQLRNLGMKVAVANHGAEALDYLRTTKFCSPDGEPLSLILMDWEMPVMDGLTCVRNIRQWKQSGAMQGHVPVIAVTANVRLEQVKIAIEAGMDDVVSKPFRIPELFIRMQKVMDQVENQ
ncbi:aerobic respiration control sensor protein-like protein arcB [Microthyrium microscopicum]|uniref:Aerobic respiration control sensor protein-like protein arcB n=1 Tax=Microthyrium microscopicum TaxID=703497 RepID=A0A6A6U0G7_9PEZI|nr:aerobic respiration control sensor protein-like protein arcB [Microthyrium microscopicum]